MPRSLSAQQSTHGLRSIGTPWLTGQRINALRRHLNGLRHLHPTNRLTGQRVDIKGTVAAQAAEERVRDGVQAGLGRRQGGRREVERRGGDAISACLQLRRLQG